MMPPELAGDIMLERWRQAHDLDFVATAHHADDQAETLLMRLNRGAGVSGLAGVRSVNGAVIRPLLGWRRAELADIVGRSGHKPLDDPSNRDDRFDRVRLRAQLSKADWVDVEAFAQSAAWLAEANAALEWMATQLAQSKLKLVDGRATLDPALLPRELRRRLVALALAHIDPEIGLRGPALADLIMGLKRGETRTLGQVRAKGGATWRFTRVTPRGKN